MKNKHDFIIAKCKCGYIARVTRNSKNMLWCPDCETGEKFKFYEDV